MKKQRNEYDSPVDALVAVSKRLSIYEVQYRRSSEEFFNKFKKGECEDSADFVEWANDYQHYVSLKLEVERQIRNVA